ncbi:MAG: biotin/lipoyl-containing protein [Acidimicrobiales bacterium]
MADIAMPQLGETVTEGTITRWFKQVGDAVAIDEVLYEVSTDKVDTEVPSPVSGTLVEIRVPEGDTVEVGTVLAVIGDGASAPAAAPAPAAPAAAPAPAPPPAPEVASAPQVTTAPPGSASRRHCRRPGPSAGSWRWRPPRLRPLLRRPRPSPNRRRPPPMTMMPPQRTGRTVDRRCRARCCRPSCAA